MDSGVSKEKLESLKSRMSRFGVREADIQEKFIFSSGKGGQNVNKTATCVYLRHAPSGIEIKCQEERSQVLNRYRARVRLVNIMENRVLGKLSEERKKIEKVRRQKRKRSKRAKEKILKLKRERSEIKKSRSEKFDGMI